MDEDRWKDSVDKRIYDIEQQLHGKNGLGEKISGLAGKVAVVLILLGTLMALILTHVLTQ